MNYIQKTKKDYLIRNKTLSIPNMKQNIQHNQIKNRNPIKNSRNQTINNKL